MIHYKSIKGDENDGKKYEVLRTHKVSLGKGFYHYFIPFPFAMLRIDGYLTIFPQYKWDGASGAIDSANFMEGSCVHDVLCEMMDGGRLPRNLWVSAAKVMSEINKREKMPWIRRQWTYAAVVLHGFRTWGIKECSLTS